MRMRLPRWTLLPLFALLLLPILAWARTGGGEHFVSSHGSGSGLHDGGGGGDGSAFIFWILIRLAIERPKVGVPLLVVFGVGYFVVHRRTDAGARTRRALAKQAAVQLTQSRSGSVESWVGSLKRVDPAFELQPLLDRVRTLFAQVQDAWFRRDLSKVRPFLSDATYQRLSTQLELLEAQGIRDALAEVKVDDVALIGLEQSASFDTVHLRINASAKDADVPADWSDEQARAAAAKKAPEPFIEVWSFVRKPGVGTRQGEDASQGQGNCPNCGAPFSGGATNTCEYCKAVVNSGNYDWTLAEITQGSEFIPGRPVVDGLQRARLHDGALNLEMLEDRASLLFWKWIRAQSRGEPRELAKLATPGFVQRLGEEFGTLSAEHRRKVFLECAVGAVIARSIHPSADGRDQAQVEIRWSARAGIVAQGKAPGSWPTLPERSVLTLVRRTGALTPADNGMSTDRCPACHAPLTDTLTSTCDYCGAELSSGDADWVLDSVLGYEAWAAQERSPDAFAALPEVAPRPVGSPDWDLGERSRLLYLMAVTAASDGVVDAKERKLLKMCSQRWSVPWSGVEEALELGDDAYVRLLPRGSGEALFFLQNLVELAKVDGKIDRKEKRMLLGVATHLGISDRLPAMLSA